MAEVPKDIQEQLDEMDRRIKAAEERAAEAAKQAAKEED